MTHSVPTRRSSDLLGMQEHYRSLSRGVVDTRDLVWFASVILFFLLAARISLNGWKRSLKGLAGWTIGLILVNVILVNYFTRLDLTADQRYTLSGQSRELLKKMEGPLVIRVFLGGDLSTDMKRLQVVVRALLTEYSAWSEEDIHVEFSDPMAAGDEAKDAARSEERRVGKAWVRKCRYRGWVSK